MMVDVGHAPSLEHDISDFLLAALDPFGTFDNSKLMQAYLP
jgi:hypothetical protein